MKKIMFTLMAMLTLAMQANAMSYEQARNEALFLTDKMAYELNLTDAQYEAAYEINLDYLMGVTSQYDVFGTYWERRNLDLSYVLFSWQWDLFRAASYFYRPLYWDAGFWHFGIYARYPHRDYFYFGRPHFFASYRGGHSWRMNGGRSFYEGRRDFYRPVGHSRDNHFGMRNGWDRGDYRGGGAGHPSSTHITGNRGGQNGGSFNESGRGGGHVNNNNNNHGGFGSSRQGSWRNGNDGGALNNGGSFGRGGSSNNGGGAQNNGGSFGRGGSSNNGGGTLNNGGTRSGGSFGGSRSGGGSFGGSRSGGSSSGGATRSGGASMGGGSRSGGSHSGGGHGSFGGSRR